MVGQITPLRSKTSWFLAAVALAVVLIVIALILFARRDDSPARPPQAVVDPATAAENELAAAMLLTLDEFPADWAEIPGAVPSAIPDICSAIVPAPIGSASSTTFSPGEGGSATVEYVLTYSTAKEAATVLDAITLLSNCYIEELLRPASDQALLEVTDATAAPFSLPLEGLRTSAFEITATALIPALSQEPLTIHDDYIFILRGSTLAEITIRSVAAPDPAARATVASKAASKLK